MFTPEPDPGPEGSPPAAVPPDRLGPRRALEALRAGVPNRDVARQLQPLQPQLEERFDRLLESTIGRWSDGKRSPGLLVAGDFGSGKSHLLEYFRHLALQQRFVCSSIVLSKETPLHDLAKVYRACVETATAPDKVGPAMVEIAHGYDPDKAPFSRQLLDWVQECPDLDPRFAATLFAFEGAGGQDEDLREKIVAEWTGYPMKVSELKSALKALGRPNTYRIARAQRGQVIQRFEFLSRFFRAAGYNGWIILLDETEMVSRYSIRQRGRAYANLAMLIGAAEGVDVPGLGCVFTITADYSGQVLYGKDDIERVPARLRGSEEGDLTATRAEAGIQVILKKAVDLRSPTPDQVRKTYQQVRQLYGTAYGWDAPDIGNRQEYSTSTRMRQYVRAWINTWDLRRLYDYQADTVADALNMSYEEDADVQAAPPDDWDEPAITL